MSATSSTSCLVLGGRGFVGSAVVRAARQAGWDVTAVGHDDYDAQVGRHFDVLVNANGNASRVRANRDPMFDFDASLRSVYRSLFDFTFGRYVLVSTVDVLNDPSSEATTSEDTPIDLATLCPYGFHKRLAEIAVMRHAASWQVLRMAQMVGTGLRKGPIFDVLQRRPLWIHPDTRLAYLNTRTAGDLLVRLVEGAPANGIYNVCGRDSVPFHRVLALFPPALQDVEYAGTEVQTYGIRTDKTHRICPLPESWDEVREFVRQVQASHGE